MKENIRTKDHIDVMFKDVNRNLLKPILSWKNIRTVTKTTVHFRALYARRGSKEAARLSSICLFIPVRSHINVTFVTMFSITREFWRIIFEDIPTINLSKAFALWSLKLYKQCLTMRPLENTLKIGANLRNEFYQMVSNQI